MTAENDLARLLIEAQRAGRPSVEQDRFAEVDRAGAYRLQAATMAALGQTAGMYKVAVAPDGTGAIGPIYADKVATSGEATAPMRNITGVEVEIGVVLSRDIPPGSDRATIEAAIERYFVGVEVCGTRYLDRSKLTFDSGLADNLSSFAYAIDPADWERGTDIDGLDVVLKLDEQEFFRAPARHGFGGVLEALVAYAKLEEGPYPLVAGTVLTTGSMCGLVPVARAGVVRAEFGGHAVTVTLT